MCVWSEKFETFEFVFVRLVFEIFFSFGCRIEGGGGVCVG